MFHIFHFLQCDTVLGYVNPLSWIFNAISNEKSCLISMPFLSTYIDVRTVIFFPTAEFWLVNSNFPPASRMQGCFMYVVSFVFKAKENLQRCWDVMFDILTASEGASALGIFNTFRNCKRSLNKRRMSPAQTITSEWTEEKYLDKRQTNPQTQARQPNKRMVKSAGRRSLPKLQRQLMQQR